MSLNIKPAKDAVFDQISLGEVMLRLDPGETRIRTAREFKAWEGGGEYNTSRGLRKCFGYRTAVATALVDNEVGHLVEDFIMQGGVATDFIKWREDDGIGRTVRNGLNFTERGFGIRGAVGNQVERHRDTGGGADGLDAEPANRVLKVERDDRIVLDNQHMSGQILHGEGRRAVERCGFHDLIWPEGKPDRGRLVPTHRRFQY